jgi:UDP-N-acetylenolpyruvoylglucosamine reductase
MRSGATAFIRRMTATGAILEMPMQSNFDFASELAARVSQATIIRRDEPLAKRTTLRVGGPADFYVEPADEKDLSAVLKFCGEHQMPFFILGRGSNLLVRDGGFRGLVICLSQPAFSQIEITGEKMRCGAGAKLKNVAVEARRNGLTGVEFLEGIPGSVGGALRMNAGAMGGQTFDAVESVHVMDFEGNVRELPPQEMSVAYRSCATLKSHVALGVVFKCKAASREEIEKRMKAYSEKRWESQPAAPSAGCIFKNPAAIPAGKLVDELGLKGMRVGGAVVSAEHGNFIINDGKATARDVLELIEILKAKAKAVRGIELHTEVEIIGED